MENSKRFHREIEGAFHSFIKCAFLDGINSIEAVRCDGMISGAIVGAKCYDGITQKQADRLFDILANVKHEYNKMTRYGMIEVTYREAREWIDECREFSTREVQKILEIEIQTIN